MNGRKSDLSHRYHTRVIANIIYSTLVACLIDVFLVTNLTMLAEYAETLRAVQRFLKYGGAVGCSGGSGLCACRAFWLLL